MVDLIAKTPCAGLLPIKIGTVTLSEIVVERMWSVAPFKGKTEAVTTALKPLGLSFPTPNRMVGKTGGWAIWAGHGMALLEVAALPDLAGLAAVADQSDAWAVVEVKGPDAQDVLARLVPVDLRAASFKQGYTARSLVGHMTASVSRLGPDTFEVMVMRSMAATLVHELTRAATLYAGRP